MKEQYQTEWVDGKPGSPGARDCADRWDLIAPVLARYERPFTILDLGANLGYFSLRATEEFDCTAVAVESAYKPELEAILERNQPDRVVALGQHISRSWLQELTDVEHFDVILGLSILHHLDLGFTEAIQILRDCSDHLIVEVATEPNACGQSVVSNSPIPHDAEILGMVPSHLGGERPVFHVGTNANLYSPSFPFMGSYLPAYGQVRLYSDWETAIYSSPTKNEERDWVPGINLMTYLTSGGFWPPRPDIDLPFVTPHGDIRPWNYVLQGTSSVLIDALDPKDNGSPEHDEHFWSLTKVSVLDDVAPSQIVERFNPYVANRMTDKPHYEQVDA